MKTAPNKPILRREFLLGLSATPALLIAAQRQAFAECISDAETYSEIRRIIRKATMQGIKVSLQGTDEAVESTLNQKRRLEERISNLVNERLSREIRDYFANETWTLTNIPLEAITDYSNGEPIILGPDHFEYTRVNSAPAQEPEHCGYVIVNFIGEMIGLSLDGVDAFRRTCEENGLEDTLGDLILSIRKGEFARARSLLEYILETLNTSENISSIMGILSRNDARKIAAWFAGRCVPLFGWALVLWDFVNAFIEYRERFQECVFS